MQCRVQYFVSTDRGKGNGHLLDSECIARPFFSGLRLERKRGNNIWREKISKYIYIYINGESVEVFKSFYELKLQVKCSAAQINVIELSAPPGEGVANIYGKNFKQF